MKAWRLHDFGGLDAIRLDDVPRPTPGAGEVLVRVEAAAANPFDWYMAEGLIAKFDITLPATMGRDGAGVVVALGKGVNAFEVGDAVYGQADPEGDGTFAEYVVFRADRLLRKPAALSFAEASALPNAIYAAWNALFSTETGLNLQPGQTVLVHGAGGGIGTLVLQLAKWREAQVIAVASSRHESMLRQLGADMFIDYTRHEFEKELVDRVDGVVDTACVEPAAKSYAILKPAGTYVSLLRTPDPLQAQAAGVRAVLAYGPNSYDQTPQIESVIASGAVRPIVGKVLPFEEVPNALAALKAGHAQGKTIIEVALLA